MLELERLFEIRRNKKEKYILYFERNEKKFYVLEEDLECGDRNLYEFDPNNEFLVKIILENEFEWNRKKMIEFFEMFNEEIARVVEGVLKWV